MESNLKAKGNSGGSGGSGGSQSAGGNERSVREMLELLLNWVSRYVVFLNERDRYIIPLWIIHTHLAEELYTTPRLLIDSPIPGSGKTTLLEHLHRFCKGSVLMANVSSSALLGRITANGIRTLLIDEADRSLDPKKPGVQDLIALLNSGHTIGATRPVNVLKGKKWDIEEMPTFAPVALAGNTPKIPEDTRTRCIVVRLLPDKKGRAQESDWEELEPNVIQLRADIEVSAIQWREQITQNSKPKLPAECKNRFRDKWKPLKRIAILAGDDWAERVDQYILQDIENIKEQEENGDSKLALHIQLVKDLYEIFEGELKFIGTETLVSKLARQNSEYWGESSMFGRAITTQRFGRLVNASFGLNSQRNTEGVRGYHAKQFQSIWESIGIPLNKPAEPTEPPKPTEPESDNGDIW
jgi:hypothetical protein